MASRVYSIWIPESLMARIDEQAADLNTTRNRLIRDRLAVSAGNAPNAFDKHRPDALVAEQPS